MPHLCSFWAARDDKKIGIHANLVEMEYASAVLGADQKITACRKKAQSIDGVVASAMALRASEEFEDEGILMVSLLIIILIVTWKKLINQRSSDGWDTISLTDGAFWEEWIGKEYGN